MITIMVMMVVIVTMVTNRLSTYRETCPDLTQNRKTVENPKSASCDGTEAETPFPMSVKKPDVQPRGIGFEDRMRPSGCCRTPFCIQPRHASQPIRWCVR
jgi:hypothetical protein